MKTLILSKENSSFCKSIYQVIELLGDITYKREHDFPKVMELVEFINSHKIDQVLMPNPYGNNKRLTCYKKLKEKNITTITSDRGALPNSWFFDSGFNFDSESYHPKSWDKPLTDEQNLEVIDYIKEFRCGLNNLEKQSERLSGEVLRQKIGMQGKKVIFVPLQRPNDTVIKYFSGFAESVAKFINDIHQIDKQINDKTNSEWIFLLKKHPLETTYYPIKSDNIFYVPDDTNVYDLIEISNTIILINSGVGLSGLLFGKQVLCLGNAFYAHDGLAIACHSIADAVIHLHNKKKSNSEKINCFLYHLLHSVYSFGRFETELIQSGESFRNETKLIDFDIVHILGKKVEKKKKVLLLSPLLPYPIYRGSQLRIDTIIRWLIDNYFEVELVALNTSFKDKSSTDLAEELLSVYPNITNVSVFKDPKFDNLSKLNRLKSKITKLFIRKNTRNEISNKYSCPDKIVRFINKRLAEKKFDYLFLNYTKTVRVIPHNYQGKIIIDTHDYQTNFIKEDQEINKINMDIDLDCFRESEHKALNRADILLAINPLEAELFKQIVSPDKKVVTIPAFIPPISQQVNFIYYNYDILYVGSLLNFNISGLQWFLNEILPKLLLLKKDIKIAIAGNISRTKDIDWNQYPNLAILGIVPDLAPLYHSSACCIAPILGGAGMKIKVIEALSYGKAIVATHKAVEGINYQNYPDSILVTNDPDKFANHIFSVISDRKTRLSVENQARELFQKEHSVSAIASILHDTFI
ncbi:glycosyltransferase [Stenoxybacter acetivorans]|uniref:glycosyltransferase n=1 Tax=Stenoxybacter acetivorans TaxID=422441 RepID=UPI00056C4415|nr:glycosyltransferase [Stenoxybacter acetivorans]